MQSIGQHRAKEKHFDSLLVRMNSSHIKNRVRLFFSISNIKRDSHYSLCHILYQKYSIYHLKVHIVLSWLLP